jgi:hypothetical protein
MTAETSVRFYKSPAVATACLFLLAGVYFVASRDFGVWLIAIFVLPVLLAIVGIFTAVEAIQRKNKKAALIAFAIIVATPLAAYMAAQFKDRVRFLVWVPAHFSELSRTINKDGIVTAWDGWGMAGMENDSYLVVDTKDRLLAKGETGQWLRRVSQSCEIVDTKRMWTRLYIVTTYNCTFEGVKSAN